MKMSSDDSLLTVTLTTGGIAGRLCDGYVVAFKIMGDGVAATAESAMYQTTVVALLAVFVGYRSSLG
jgi:hypothetical protein